MTEIVDPETLAPLEMKEGVEGEIVFTTINRQATPVIRYRVRDMVRVYTDDCPCGRTGFRFHVIGRTDDMIKVKGVNVFPAAVKGIIQNFAPVTTGEMRIVLPHPGPSFGENITIKVEAGEGLKPDEKDAVAQKSAAPSGKNWFLPPGSNGSRPTPLRSRSIRSNTSKKLINRRLMVWKKNRIW